MPEADPKEFVTSYSWLVGPGDALQVDYTTPTRVRTWQQTTPVVLREADKQEAYGRWIAQLLHTQLGIPLVSLYHEAGHQQWPFTLRDDVIAHLDQYFSNQAASGQSR